MSLTCKTLYHFCIKGMRPHAACPYMQKSVQVQWAPALQKEPPWVKLTASLFNLSRKEVCYIVHGQRGTTVGWCQSGTAGIPRTLVGWCQSGTLSFLGLRNLRLRGKSGIFPDVCQPRLNFRLLSICEQPIKTIQPLALFQTQVAFLKSGSLFIHNLFGQWFSSERWN